MALTNHVFVRLAGARCGFERFSRYQIIGDDIVIFDYNVAKSYIDILTAIGVKYNNDDTIWPYKDMKPYEIAKRLFRNGKEVSRIDFNLLDTNEGLFYWKYLDLYLQSTHESRSPRFTIPGVPLNRSFTAALLMWYYTSTEG
jgi:hypothetical protein